MDPVSTICVILVIFGTSQTNAYLKQEIYNHGENAAVLFENITTDGKKSLDIVFSGFTKKQHDIHMFFIGQKTNNQSDIQVSRHYYIRIKDVNMNNGSLKFLLLNVTFMDSGTYTVSEGYLQKGKRRIFVTRRILTGQVSKPMILPFICNYNNTSSIKIGMSRAFDYVDYIIYDMTHKNCTNTKVTQDYKDRNFSCVLNDANFDLTFTELTWQDRGAYIAWDDQGLLLDALFLGIPDNNTSSTPGTATPDSSSQKGEHGHMHSTTWPLVSSVVIVLVAAFLALVTVRKLREREGKKTKEKEINCSDPDQSMYQAINTALQRDDDDDGKYEEPSSTDMELTAYIEPISQPVQVYERLHPYGNQGNNMYRSLRPDGII